MSKAAHTNWADDDGSSDEGSVGGNEEVPVVEEPVKSTVAPETKPTHSSRSSGFTVHVSNLPYSVDDITLGNFFVDGQCNVKDVIMHVDRETKRSRGSAHVEFLDQASMDKALTANGVDFGGRALSVTIAEDRKGFRGGGDRDRGGRQSGGRNNRDRDYQPRGDRDRGDRGDRDRGDRGDRDRGDRGDRDRGDRGDRRERRDRDDNRDGSFDNRRGQRGDGFGSGRGGGRGGGRGDRERSPRGAPNAAPAADAATPAAAPAAERPKLNLAPRTLPVEAVGAPVVNPSIFGDGKARDEAKVAPSSAAPAATKAADVPPPAPPVDKEVKSAATAEGVSDARGGAGGRGRGDRRDKDRGGRGGRGEGRGADKDKKSGAGRGERSPRGEAGAGRGNKQQKGKPAAAQAAAAAAPGTDALAEKVIKS
jgi:RNA recognition motif-containing protein